MLCMLRKVLNVVYVHGYLLIIVEDSVVPIVTVVAVFADGVGGIHVNLALVALVASSPVLVRIL